MPQDVVIDGRIDGVLNCRCLRLVVAGDVVGQADRIVNLFGRQHTDVISQRPHLFIVQCSLDLLQHLITRQFPASQQRPYLHLACFRRPNSDVSNLCRRPFGMVDISTLRSGRTKVFRRKTDILAVAVVSLDLSAALRRGDVGHAVHIRHRVNQRLELASYIAVTQLAFCQAGCAAVSTGCTRINNQWGIKSKKHVIACRKTRTGRDDCCCLQLSGQPDAHGSHSSFCRDALNAYQRAQMVQVITGSVSEQVLLAGLVDFVEQQHDERRDCQQKQPYRVAFGQRPAGNSLVSANYIALNLIGISINKHDVGQVI